MAQCLICEKKIEMGNNVSHSHRKTKRTFKPNILHKTILIANLPVKGKVCAKCYKKYQAQNYKIK